MVKLLLKLGARVDSLGHAGQGEGWTPLSLAARAGAVDVAKVLLSARADVHAVCANGKTALEIATVNSHRKDCHAVCDVLHTEMVASVLEMAFRFSAQRVSE